MKIVRITDREGIYRGINLWNRENPAYQIRERLIEQNIFAPYAGVNVVGWECTEQDELLAFGLAKYLDNPITDYTDPATGWLSLLVVNSKSSTGCLAGKALLVEIERYLSRKGVQKLRMGGDPQNFLAGLPVDLGDYYLSLLEECGFSTYSREFDLYCDISGFSVPARIEKIEAEFKGELLARPVTMEEETYLLNFLQTNFPGRWYYEAENIKRIPGGIDDYWLLWYQEKAVGFVRTNTADSAYLGCNVNWGSRWGNKYCGLGPIGIDNNFRGKGWGLYLMVLIINNFREKGYRHMVIDWTTLVEYYRKLGFTPFIEYRAMVKEGLEGS